MLSTRDSRRLLDAQVAEYLAAGVRLVWVIDPEKREAEVHRPGEPPRVVGLEDRLDGLDVVPGFACRLDELFS